VSGNLAAIQVLFLMTCLVFVLSAFEVFRQRVLVIFLVPSFNDA
tara:strand:- start:355 stop:486 length:132 start_codon:yes stop_codon:yes gene_type:complete